MNRPAKIVCFSLLLLPTAAVSAPGANATGSAQSVSNVIYKHVDESGRVTYANSPIKGGARVDLEPLTVIPSTPSGSLNAANAQVVAPPASARAVVPVVASAVAAVVPAATTAKPPVQVATVLPVSTSYNQAQAVPAKQLIAPAPDNNVVASLDAMNLLTQQRRAETKKRLLEGELQTCT